MSYGSVAGVEALVPSLGTLGEEGAPTSGEVDGWLAQAYALINRKLATAGYGTPIPATATLLLSELAGIENLYAAAYVLRALSIDTVSGEGEDRSEVWLRDFYLRLNDLLLSNLTLLGATVITVTTGPQRRRLRSTQMRKVDGYSRGPRYEVHQGEYTGPTMPSE